MVIVTIRIERNRRLFNGDRNIFGDREGFDLLRVVGETRRESIGFIFEGKSDYCALCNRALNKILQKRLELSGGILEPPRCIEFLCSRDGDSGEYDDKNGYEEYLD